MSSAKHAQLLPALNRAVRLFIAGSSLYSQRVAEKLGLHPTDMQFLNLLDLLGPMTPGALAQCSGLSSGGVTVVLDRLEGAGYVRRAANPSDRRSVVVHLVAAHHRRVMANFDAAQSRFDASTAHLSIQELEAVMKFFSAANEMRSQGTQDRAKEK
jgi:DNA-binding MarR family transcriptional regulator